MWQRAYDAFMVGGASLARDAKTDKALFDMLITDGLHSSEQWPPQLTELFDAYGRR
ncbi:hypothetical protein [Streptomyces tendae]|uniref:hypothetical protein n=1 Tax=Streptomyces tendae TaxID=1932 RepID=UPI0037237C99